MKLSYRSCSRCQINNLLFGIFNFGVWRIVELFKQPAFNPIPIEMQAAVLWAMQNNYFDSIEVTKIVEAANHLKEFLGTRKNTLLDTLRQKSAIDDTLAAELKKALEEWKGAYTG